MPGIFNASAYSTHVVSGWTLSLPLRVLYRWLRRVVAAQQVVLSRVLNGT
jgi:hypothetical protein